MLASLATVEVVSFPVLHARARAFVCEGCEAGEGFGAEQQVQLGRRLVGQKIRYVHQK